MIFFQENFEKLDTKLTAIVIELLAESLFSIPCGVKMQKKKPSDSLSCASGL